MKTDFHFGVTKVLARAAGFDETTAQTIAYASQYTDDASEHQPLHIEGITKLKLDAKLEQWLHLMGVPGKPERPLAVRLHEGYLFDPICTAHGGLDYLKAVKAEIQRKVYVSFHFLPELPSDGSGGYCYRTRPNSVLAKKLVGAVAGALGSAGTEAPELTGVALCALGISLHTYADTWAHEGFSGRWDKEDNNLEAVLANGEPIKSDALTAIGKLVPIGHIDASDHPDRTHEKLEILFKRGEHVVRSNVPHFLEAAKAILGVLAGVKGTDASAAWQTVETPLRLCLSVPMGEDKRLVLLEKQFGGLPGFGGLTLRYDCMEWERKAVTMVVDPGDPTGGMSYELTGGDVRWFDFHVAAAGQRAFVKGIRAGGPQ